MLEGVFCERQGILPRGPDVSACTERGLQAGAIDEYSLVEGIVWIVQLLFPTERSMRGILSSVGTVKQHSQGHFRRNALCF